MRPETSQQVPLPRFEESAKPPETAWAAAWVRRGETLLDLACRFENAGPEGCATLLVRIRESRPDAEEAPDPELVTLATIFLDELWEAARRLLYGDLDPARMHASIARRQLEAIRTRSRALPS